MQGQYLQIGGRTTYFPPFVNEVFGNPPYWSCTFTSLLNGANVGWLGKLPATTDEIRALAKASGDVDTKGGSRSSHMVKAMQVRYGRKVQIESLSPERVKERLSKGWAMVGGVTYGLLPEIHRRPSPAFKGGHRIVLLGWDDGRTRILDPMERHDHTFTGRWIRWADFEPAWWSTEQLWFREGMMLDAPIVKTLRAFPKPRIWRVREGTVVAGRSLADPRQVVVRHRLTKNSSARFDAWVEVRPRQDKAVPLGRFIRVTNGRFAGLLIDPGTEGIKADVNEIEGRPAAGSAAAATTSVRRQEYDRLKQQFDAGDGTFPPFTENP
ncbi:MAG TPA: hypothetical protein VFJ71_08495 [Candidatus Limnocylindrales bacterium]|nr:hypothetical protein [Candidatus Limnocylindrales bacterium]